MVERRFAHARQRVFLVDDHPLVREWLANVINQQWDLMVCGESEGRENCLEAIGKKKPHVVVMDISLKDCSGLDLIAEIKQQIPEVEIIVLSMHSSPLYAKRALRAGASGYVVKRETTRRICQAIREVLNGVPYISKEVGPSSDPSTSEENFDLALLSEREREIFRWLGHGHPTRQIAHNLGISIKTVQVHCGNIRDKMGIPGPTNCTAQRSVGMRGTGKNSVSPAWQKSRFGLRLRFLRRSGVASFPCPQIARP